MNAFAFGADSMFEDPNMGSDAVFRAGGSGTAVNCRVIISAPDAVSEFNAGRFVSDSVIIAVRTGEMAILAIGDTFEVAGETLQVFAEPQRDALRLVWKAQARAV